MARRILVTGCPRSGTGYLAALLTRLGVPCGHAAHLHPQALEFGVPGWPAGLEAESSWYAAPYTDELPAGSVVVHLVREPASALRSLWRVRLFRARSVERAFLERHAPEVLYGTPIQQTARAWLSWNQLAEGARDAGALRYVRVRLESLDESALRWIGELSEREIEPMAARRALAEAPRDVQHTLSDPADGATDWSELRGSPLLAEIDELAARYGYGRAALSGLIARAA